ncbi:MAG: hypothetical protein HY691_07745 [Chloroflexi bacterium]|nr:hypothetical protein [Chloroflexota bacterium]
MWRAVLFGLLIAALATIGNVPFDPLRAVAQSEPVWTSGTQVQNLGSAPANVKLTYYEPDGSVAATQTVVIQPGLSYTFYGETMAVRPGFRGSIVIEADQPIASITNQIASNPTMADAYAGIVAPATTAFLPLVMRDHQGWTTEIFVQNGGAAAANAVKLDFYRGKDLVLSETLPAIAPGASYTLRQGAQDRLGATFVGSVKITADQPVASVVNQTNGRILMSYAGFTSGGSRVYAPLIMNNNRGWSTGLQVMNVGATEATVTLRVGGRAADSAAIGPGQSKTWYPIPGTAAGFVGSAVVEGSPGAQLVGIVNEIHPEAGQGMTYTAFNTGSSRISAPLIMNDNRGWSTGLQVMNVGAQDASVTLKVDGQPAATAVIPAGQSQTWYPVPGTSPGFVGSATVEGPSGTQLVGIVNELKTRDVDGDLAMAYVTFSQ